MNSYYDGSVFGRCRKDGKVHWVDESLITSACDKTRRAYAPIPATGVKKAELCKKCFRTEASRQFAQD